MNALDSPYWIPRSWLAILAIGVVILLAAFGVRLFHQEPTAEELPYQGPASDFSSPLPTVRTVHFSPRNVTAKSDGEAVMFMGEIKNNSGRAWQFATFTLSLYDRNEILLDTSPIIIQNFSSGITKSFKVWLYEIKRLPKGWQYKLDLENAL